MYTAALSQASLRRQPPSGCAQRRKAPPLSHEPAPGTILEACPDLLTVDPVAREQLRQERLRLGPFRAPVPAPARRELTEAAADLVAARRHLTLQGELRPGNGEERPLHQLAARVEDVVARTSERFDQVILGSVHFESCDCLVDPACRAIEEEKRSIDLEIVLLVPVGLEPLHDRQL